MRVYSTSFFHFTKDFIAIKGIIKDGFNITFCREEVCSRSKKVMHIGIPMASFCDVTLNFITSNNYGNIGIGMSRPWGIDHLLQPVMYYPNNKECQSTQMIIQAVDEFINNKDAPDSYRILGYAKPIKKFKPERNQNDDNYIEREWRKVYKSYGPQQWKTDKEYKKYRGAKKTPKPKVGSPLRFSVNDIDCIILPQKYIGEFIDYIFSEELNMIGGKYNVDISLRDRQLLLSKIIQYESLELNL